VVLGFIGSFLLAYFLFAFCASFFTHQSSTFTQIAEQEGDDVFTEALVVKGPSNALRISDSPKLSPQAGTDFLFFVWFKLREPLGKEERVYLMGKYDPESRDRVGYGVALAGGPDGIRPQVYWQPANEAGKWFTFASAPLKPQRWYLLVASFRDQKYLGVHLAALGDSGKPQVLGGYSVDAKTLPVTPADLVVGAFGSTFFHGRIGPFGIIQSKAFSDDVGAFVRAMAKEPLVLPDSIDAEEVALWASPRKDRGPQALPILNARSRREVQDRDDSKK